MDNTLSNPGINIDGEIYYDALESAQEGCGGPLVPEISPAKMINATQNNDHILSPLGTPQFGGHNKFTLLQTLSPG